MNINVLVLMLLTTIIGLYSWKAFLHQGEPPPSQLPWTPISTSKPRFFVNKTSDAGLHIERVRRSAIIRNGPTFSYKGSTNGSLEYYFLSGVLTGGRYQEPVCPEAYSADDGGNATAEFCDYIDGNGQDILDAGNADLNLCDL